MSTMTPFAHARPLKATALPWLLTALLIALVTACGGSGQVSAKSLEPRLLPASAVPGFGLARTLDWSDPVNLVGEGVALAGFTHPSAGVKEFQDAHLKSAAGEILTRGAGLEVDEIHVGVAKLGSASDAVKVRGWMHGQDLSEPCPTACVFRPQPMKLSEVPDSAAVVQTAIGEPASAPANYRAEFTRGPYLYWVWFQGNPSETTKSMFAAGISRYYQHAKQQS
jgi:hypothetical protein